jgi:type II secretory pathway pseudopilin PulG
MRNLAASLIVNIREETGVTLFETVAAIVIIGIMVAGFSAVYTFSITSIASANNDTNHNLSCRAVVQGYFNGADITSGEKNNIDVTTVQYGEGEPSDYENIDTKVEQSDVTIHLNGDTTGNIIIKDARYIAVYGPGLKAPVKYDIILPPEPEPEDIQEVRK